MDMEKNNLESVWADGVPQKINPEDVLPPKHILDMCIRFTLEQIIKDKGYKVLGVNDDLKSYPKILLEKENQQYAIAVVPCVYPNFIQKNDDLRIRFVKGCQQQKAVPVLCPVLIHSQDKERAMKSIMLKGDLFRITNIGQLILTDEETQEILPKSLTFKL